MPRHRAEQILFKGFRMSVAMSDAVNDYRFNHRLSNESEALRTLIEAGLKALTPERPAAEMKNPA
jgi:hypothetical protein